MTSFFGGSSWFVLIAIIVVVVGVLFLRKTLFQKLISLILTALLLVGLGFLIYWYRPTVDTVTIENTQRAIVKLFESTIKLETAEMNISQVLEGKQELNQFLEGYQITNAIQQFLFQDTINMVAEGVLKAGFDLKKMPPNGIVVHDDLSVTLTLPQPEILSTSITTKTLDRDLGLLTKGNIELEGIVREKAQIAFQEKAIADGLLEKAKENAQQELQKVLGTLVRIKEITFVQPLQ
jgi:hypothetical protein